MGGSPKAIKETLDNQRDKNLQANRLFPDISEKEKKIQFFNGFPQLSKPTLSCSLPSKQHNTVDLGAGAQVHHEDRLVHVVVVHDGAVGQVGVLLPVNGQGAVAVLPLLPRVALVVHPGVALVRLVGNWKEKKHISRVIKK